MLTLADAILQEDLAAIRQLLYYGDDVNQLDEYGFTPLIEAAIVNNLEISKLLLNKNANPNQQDVTGGTALHWAVENNNLELARLLLSKRANPNAYNFAGQSVLVMPLLRGQAALKELLIKAGADQLFAQDYINVKLIGHLFELSGTTEIFDPKYQLVEVDFEGFFLEVTLNLIANSLEQFQNHFAARQLRRYSGLSQFIVEIMHRSAQLIKYQQYRIDIEKIIPQIDTVLQEEPLLIPIGYEGHAITFIKFGDIWVKCDRREESRLYDNIMFYRINNPQNITKDFLRYLIYEKQSSEFVNHDLDQILGLQPITELKVTAQISGNCSWANVEAAIPAIFFVILMQKNKDSETLAYYKTLALNYFHRFRQWNKDRILNFCIQSYEEADVLRKASKAEILAAILFQCTVLEDAGDRARIETILPILANSPYAYLLQNYVRIYYYESPTPEGKKFYDMLRSYGFIK